MKAHLGPKPLPHKTVFGKTRLREMEIIEALLRHSAEALAITSHYRQRRDDFLGTQ